MKGIRHPDPYNRFPLFVRCCSFVSKPTPGGASRRSGGKAAR